MKAFKIGKKWLGEGHPTFIIAEMSANHGGKLDTALEIIRAAKRAGADAVKLQTYRADTITMDSHNPDFLLPADSPWQQQKNLYSLYEKAHMPWEWHEALYAEANKLDIEIFSSPFDRSAVSLLAKLDSVAYKIASPEITDIPLIEAVAQQEKPIIFSTGLAEYDDIDLAVKILKKHNHQQFVFLKCTTAYPAPVEEANLRLIQQIKQDFDCLTGLSDHTLGHEVAIASVALGGDIIEKHFMLNDSEETADSFFSLTEDQFAAMVKSVRKVELALGYADYSLSASAKANLRGRRSLYIAKDIKAGEIITEQHLKSVRPSFGLHPKYYQEVIGKKVSRDLHFGDRLSLEAICD